MTAEQLVVVVVDERHVETMSKWFIAASLLAFTIAALWLTAVCMYIAGWPFILTSDSESECGAADTSICSDDTLPPNYKINVAFAGNSMMYVNDLPRFMQEITGKSSQGEYLIHQNSCLHGALNFKALLEKGNGMLLKWNTDNAYIGNGLYDFGVCTVRQLLLGYDDNASPFKSSGIYTNDGMNPCFHSRAYFDYLNDTAEIQKWDFCVLNDRTTFPAMEDKKNQSLRVLKEHYVPMLGNSTPVLYATHGYESSVVNVSSMGNVSEFTSRVFEGYRQYAQLLDENLPRQPRIAPVGLAFLLVYEENREMWNKLVYVDGFHPSPHGSYLMGCVLYATLYGTMPGTLALPSDPKTLWKRARKMQTTDHVMPFPTYNELQYLYQVARRVMILNHRPNTWIRYFNDSESDYIAKRD